MKRSTDEGEKSFALTVLYIQLAVSGNKNGDNQRSETCLWLFKKYSSVTFVQPLRPLRLKK
jgi:hypothetical protein